MGVDDIIMGVENIFMGVDDIIRARKINIYFQVMKGHFFMIIILMKELQKKCQMRHLQ